MEYRWVSSACYLKNDFRQKADGLDYAGGVFCCDMRDDCLFSEFSQRAFSGDRFRLNQTIKTYLKESLSDERVYEGYFCYEDETYYLYRLIDGKVFLGFVVDLSRCFTLGADERIVYSDGAGNVLLCQGAPEVNKRRSDDALEVSDPRYAGHTERVLDGLAIKLVYQNKRFVIWSRPGFIFSALPAVFAAWFAGTRIYKIIIKIVYQPIDHLVYRITEYSAEREALLRYYQLQVRPHFFLNCLNLIRGQRRQVLFAFEGAGA